MGQTHGLVASGTWQTVKSRKKLRIGSWADEEAGQSILFVFKKNGQIKIYSDQNNDGKIHCKKDVLIGDAKFNDWDSEHYSKKHFLKKASGDFEIEVEGWTNDDGKYEAWYTIRLDTGVEKENFLGTMLDVNKFVEAKDHDFLTSLFQPDL